ncbi:S41 family peptidase [Aquimarina sp. 2201CG1-2-11]|uniref:S41 family peptidase n=1 Tax=Aquimarina discodermiae TaxID=3231043 RepID=UPI003463639E
MKRIFVIILLFTTSLHFGQPITNNDVIKEIQTLLETNYIFLDKAKESNTHLNELVKNDFFTKMSPDEFTTAVTEELQKITKDKHLKLWPPREKAKKVSEKSFVGNLSRYQTPMLRGFQLFESNIGYIDLAFFGGGATHLEKIDLAMRGMQAADAIIIDMRNNTGGSPRTVNYLSSYFFNQELLLNSIYSRAQDYTEELFVVDVKGVKRPKVPVYILTSKKTFSGAEDFSYTMQSRGRATIIGEVTGGGAHPTRGFLLKGGFDIGIPFARTINPVTKTNWEGVGVQPDIKISANDALEKARNLALDKAKEYRDAFFEPLKKALSSIESTEATESEKETLFEQFDVLVKVKMLNESEINTLGYSYVEKNNIKSALFIFEINTRLFPNSANTWDSLAEAYLKMENKEKATKYYEKALKMDPEGWVGENAKEMLQKIKSL